MTTDFLQRTWAQVDLDRVDHNFHAIRAQVRPETLVCCVIKADAYGHGAEMLAKEYESLGADWFAVSNLEEALQLRGAGISRPILILGYTPPRMARSLSENRIAQAVLSSGYARELSAEAVKAGVAVRAHLKVDTGMGRIGFLYQDPGRDAGALDEMERVCRLPGLDPEGIFTHFAVADEGWDGEAYTRKQYRHFTEAAEHLKRRGVPIRIRHCANSAAILDYPEMQLDMVRPGIILYGLMPSRQVEHGIGLVPALALKSVVSLVKEVEPDTSVSYGRRFIAEKRTKVATVPIGYADGYPRHLYLNGSMLVRGRRAKIIGRVCMDQLMLDVTDIPGVREGDIVTVIGKDGENAVTADDLAALCETISYEIVCMISKRVPRVYYRGGKEIGMLDYLRR